MADGSRDFSVEFYLIAFPRFICRRSRPEEINSNKELSSWVLICTYVKKIESWLLVIEQKLINEGNVLDIIFINAFHFGRA